MNKFLSRTFSATLILTMVMSMVFVAQPAYAAPRSFANPTTTVFINEFHYDNASTDSGEAIEVAGPAGTDLTGWDIVLYNGSGGVVYDTDALSGIIPNQQGGYGTVVLSYPSNGIQNGAPDGIALVDASDTVVQFLSYEGSFTAVGGPANGLTSTDIGVSQSGSGAAGNSLQLTGSGSTYGNFTWAAEAANTFGAPNTGQTFVVSGPTNPTGSGSATPSTVAPGDPTLLTVTVTPGTNPASTGLAVSCDLSSIGGSATQAFADDGLNGDVTAGDNIFSFAATVDSGTSEGAKSLACSITDAEARVGNASIALTVQEPVALIINEILADPDGTNGDANGDGLVEATNDEFVEIVNNEPSSLDISGWTLSDFVGVRHTFPANTVIPASCSIVVFAAGTPTGTFGRSLVQVSSTGQLGLNNGGDTVKLNNGAVDVASYAYGAEGGDNQSLTRDPDVTGADPLVKHSTATGSGGALFSPGTLIDGSQFSGCPAELKIHDVQGNGAASPLVGQTVVVTGVVVGDFQDGASGTNGDFNGFHVQEEDADVDADPLTSEGIFVFDGSSPAVNVAIGDLVQVQGVVSEFNGLTEITSFTGVTVLNSGNPLPSAATVSLPVTAVTDFEAYEGMRVTFPQALVISEYFNFDRFGEIVLTSERHLTPTAEFEPGSPQQQQAVQDFLLDKITLDDGRSSQNPDPALHPNGNVFDLTNLFRGGDTLTNVTGVVDFANGVYKIQPTQGAGYASVNPRTTSPDPVGGRLRVASMNTLNFFLTLDTTNSDTGPGPCGGNANLDCRGADASQPLEFTRQRDKLLAALTGLDADIIGLNELENTPGVDPLGDPTNGIVAGLNATFGPGTYSYINTGVIGADAIRVGLVYKTTTVVPVGAFEILDSTDDPLFLDTKSRPSLAQTFEEIATGERFTVVVNHFKSKGSACTDVGDPDLGDGQGNCSQTRKNAAIALVNWLATDPTNSGDSDFLIMGDLNSYDKEESIDTILAGGFTDLAYQFHGEDAYSYVFDGQTGYLDYALANTSMFGQVTGMTDWHINSDEPDLIDYDTSFKGPNQDAIYAADPYRSSDHDPVIVGLNLLPQCHGKNATVYVDQNGVIVGGQLDGQVYNGTLIGTSGDDVIVGSEGQDTILALGGNDIVCALDGNDVTLGSLGNDTIFSGAGDDVVFGNAGNDTIEAGEGNDAIFGEVGDDAINGGGGKDIVDGGAGVDSVVGGDENDVVRGGSGNDALDGGSGSDYCNGGFGSDTDTSCEVRVQLP
ncbi:MAG: ExeM/NucH family extracellular endonuclease [Anaerolineales bacterium]|nr:ExeM/NucH family extracellular endonuclease [Anaerolineales bacterium]